jgi:glutamine amidotransferase
MIAMVDMDLGNLGSVRRAFGVVGLDVKVTDRPADVAAADALILPGVGAFGDGIDALRAKHLVEPILKHARAGKPLLGICVGMQLLADTSEEHGLHQGLGLIPGEVKRLVPNRPGYRVPNMGWCDVRVLRQGVLFDIGDRDPAFYFAHSYFYRPQDPGQVLATIEYSGQDIAVAVQRENVVGFQFHPEKSQDIGLGVLDRYRRHLAACGVA